tara:strand:+ start:85 stop:1254 length:1170 start_codon:yes stop_codon:yes gene_type:complete
MNKKKVCVITGSRADYGLLKNILKCCVSRSEITLQLIATGMHLSDRYGYTCIEIEDDGFKINKKIEVVSDSDLPSAISKSIGSGVNSFTDAFVELKPDIIIILGDRYEIFSAAIAAMAMNLPIAHIHGGELTEGVIDDVIRHSITKLSDLHFVSTEDYKNRVIQLGEEPKNIFNVGALALDSMADTTILSKEELLGNLGLLNNSSLFLVTYHPVTLDLDNSNTSIDELLRALDEFSDANIIFTGVNSDASNSYINKKISKYIESDPQRLKYITNLGQQKYFSVMKYSEVVIGNSSSGIIEAPSFKVPTVNIGIRQNGRIKANSIIDCVENKAAIVDAINSAISEDMKETCSNVVSPYAGPGVSEKIVDTIVNKNLEKIKIKRFYDLKVK